MTFSSDSLAHRVQHFYETHQSKNLLRLIVCGSAEEGKSTLIARMLYEAKLSLDNRLDRSANDQKIVTGQGGYLGNALWPGAHNGECGTSGDVAYHFFAMDRRNYVVGDIPGDDTSTLKLVRDALTADLAIIRIDASKGVLAQTRRYLYLLSLLGICHVVAAVIKMDLVGYSKQVFETIERDCCEFAQRIGISDVVCVPLSAEYGDNVTKSGANMPWYRGHPLMSALEAVEFDEQGLLRLPLRVPVQSVDREKNGFCGLTGTIASGTVRQGQRIRVQPSGQESTITRIVAADGDLDLAIANQSVTLTLADKLDVSSGEMISAADSPAQVADQFEATVVWMSDQPLLRGRNYLIKTAARTVTATVAPLKYKINIDTLDKSAATKLERNEIGVVDLELDAPIAFDPFRENRGTGRFTLIDRMSNDTVGAGVLAFALRRAANIHWQAVEVDKAARQALAGHRSGVIWLTGLSGAGKSTVANLLEKRLHALGLRTYLLDGDNVRHGLNKDLGFASADRVENIRRIAEVAKLMVDAGVIVITAFISPFRAERAMARDLMAPGEFIEVFVDTPIEIAEQRDPKGLYKKARSGALKNFTGIDSPYEPPEKPEIRVDGGTSSAEEATERVFSVLVRAGWFVAP